jgi:hypothetical protein
MSYVICNIIGMRDEVAKKRQNGLLSQNLDFSMVSIHTDIYAKCV